MITLSSDFGSPYPAAMKGVILSRTDARLVDVAHDLPRQDVRQAAFWLREVLPYFPPALHLVVVDPGVGTDRLVLVAAAGDHVIVGPDNGVVVPVAEALDDDPTYYVTAVEDPESSTFHGRAVFAPLAADIHEYGLEQVVGDERFERTADVVGLAFPEATIDHDGATGEILVVDDFGNAITNIPGSVLADSLGSQVTVNGESAPARSTYADVEPRERLVTVGSHGNVELAVNRGRGTDAFGVEVGDSVVIRDSTQQ